MKRRQLLKVIPGLLVAPKAITQEARPQDILLSAQGRDSNHYSLSWANSQFSKTFDVASGFRGHGVDWHPAKPNRAILYARRPGTIALEVDLSKQEITQSFSCSSFNHFTGHGCFSAEGNYLFTSESNFKTGAGKIVVRDSRDFQILTEYDSQGIGPHEIKLMPDGKTLAIANGGILTHPDSGRKKLNLDSMQSSLNYMDIVTGKTLASYQVAEPKASIRHIDISPQGSVAIAMQLQREACRHNNIIPLCAYHQGEDQIQLLQAAKPLLNQFNDYVGSTTINANNHIAGFTSPRGDIAAFWSLKTGQIKGFHQLHDVCGLAISHDSEYFILSNSHGEVRYLDSETLVENRQLRKVYPDTSWDNHLLTLRA